MCNSLNRETILSHDALIEALSGYIETGPDGTVRHYNSSGKLHRIGGPAAIFADGTEIWYQNGVLHRTDGPAVFDPQSLAEEYWVNGELHRTDGPAIRTPDGSLHWFIHNQKHREDGPAIIYADGTEIWYRYGLRHRDSGPAAIYKDGTRKWYTDGVILTVERGLSSTCRLSKY